MPGYVAVLRLEFERVYIKLEAEQLPIVRQIKEKNRRPSKKWMIRPTRTRVESANEYKQQTTHEQKRCQSKNGTHTH